MGESPNPDWITQWQALARPYLSAWQNAAQGGAPAAAASPSMQDGFEQWARLFASTGGQGETIERVIDSAKSYAAFMQSTLASMANAPDGVLASWSDAMRQAMPGANAAMFEHPAVRAWHNMMADPGGNAGFAQVFGALDALRAPPAGAGDLKALLNLPAFGLMREHQEHAQKTALAWLDYKEQMGRYNALMLDAAQRGFAHFESKLAEREQPGRQIESLRGLYDLWVDAAEEGYAEVALSPKFREVYGALVNAQMRVRAQIQQEVERLSVDLGMPTRSEINSIGERLQALRREVRARGAGGSLADELAALRAEFASFKAGARRAAAAAAVRGEAAPEPVAKPASGARRRKAGAAPAPARTRTKPAAKKAAAETAPGSFASRIEKYARSSLGATRAKKSTAAAKSPQSARSTRSGTKKTRR